MKIDMMHYESIPIESIVPNPDNPRVALDRNTPTYQDLRRSIERFDYIDPIIWNKATGHIISGHQRFQVLKDIAEDKGEEITKLSVIVIETDKQHQDALMIAVNKLTGIWDTEKLTELFEGIDKDDWQYTGYSEFEIKDLMNEPIDIDDGEEITDTELPANIVRPQIYTVTIGYDTKEERKWIFDTLGIKDNGDRYEVSKLMGKG